MEKGTTKNPNKKSAVDLQGRKSLAGGRTLRLQKRSSFRRGGRWAAKDKPRESFSAKEKKLAEEENLRTPLQENSPFLQSPEQGVTYQQKEPALKLVMKKKPTGRENRWKAEKRNI